MDKASTLERCKTLPGEMAKPTFVEQSVHSARSLEVKWNSPFLVYKHRVDKASGMKGVKHLRGKRVENPSFGALGTCSQVLPRYRYLGTMAFI